MMRRFVSSKCIALLVFASWSAIVLLIRFHKLNLPGFGSNYPTGGGKILCWILTGPDYHERIVHVRNTWGRRCDKLLFLSSELDEERGTVKLSNVREGWDFLWGKTKAALQHIWTHHGAEFDWFFKADDDTYVVVENLRAFLRSYSPSDALYFGSREKSNRVKQGFNHGGAGYALSRAALKQVVEYGLSDPSKCYQGPEGGEDHALGGCMEKLGIQAGDTRDEEGRVRFLPYRHHLFLMPDVTGRSFYYSNVSFFPAPQSDDHVSPIAISFHKVSPEGLYIYDYLIYTLKVPGKQ